MTFVESVKAVLTNYAGFRGRSARPEFWWFNLFALIVSIVFTVFSGNDGSSFLGIVGTLVSLALVVPSFAVGARRLHDIGRSGWYQLFLLIPLVGIIILIVWWARAGDPTDNAFGTAPAIPVRPATS